MQVDLKQLMIILVLVALFVLLIVLIVVVKNLLPTIKALPGILDDVSRITKVAAEGTEKVDGVLGEASDVVLNIADTVRGNASLISKATNIGAGLASAKDIASRFRTSEESEYLNRARARKASKAKK